MAIIKPDILQTVIKAIQDTAFGSIILVVQDSYLIQMDKLEKIRFVVNHKQASDKGIAQKTNQEAEIKSKVLAALKGLEYGQVLLSVKGGGIVQIERTEKQRIKKLQGVDGEGI